jgi:hypothetical protein
MLKTWLFRLSVIKSLCFLFWSHWILAIASWHDTAPHLHMLGARITQRGRSVRRPKNVVSWCSCASAVAICKTSLPHEGLILHGLMKKAFSA